MIHFALLFLFRTGSCFKRFVGEHQMVMDRAWITLDGDLESLALYYHQDECFKCSWSKIEGNGTMMLVDMRWPIRFMVDEKESTGLSHTGAGKCRTKFMHMEQGGIYTVTLKDENCDFTVGYFLS